MADLLYMLVHPLLARIHDRCLELEDEAERLPEGSRERNSIEKRLVELEEYGLPKPDRQEQQRSTVIVSGEMVGYSHSLRRRHKERRRGRPAEYRLQVRAALEEKCANPRLKWAQLAEKYSDPKKSFPHKFKDSRELERAVRRLKLVLQREGIQPPSPEDYPKHN